MTIEEARERMQEVRQEVDKLNEELSDAISEWEALKEKVESASAELVE